MKSKMRSTAAAFFLVMFVVEITHAQCQPQYTFSGAGEGASLGHTVCSAGDVNNDGYDDVIIGAPGYDTFGGNSVGRAYVFSGQNGDTLYVFSGEEVDDYFGTSVASAGDVNNDGYSDVIVGAAVNGGAGSYFWEAYVFSGLDGDTLYVFSEAASDAFGYSVAGAGDVNNDSYSDVIVGAPFDVGRAYVFSGQNGDTLYVFSGQGSGQFGSSVASAGDVNNDGYADVIIGAPQQNNTFPYNLYAGRAYVFSGQTGQTLREFRGQADFEYLGSSVSSAGDVDNDGYSDVIVGTPGYNDDFNGYDVGRADVYSGRTLNQLYGWIGEAEFDHFGNSVSSAGDADNDGYDDVIIGAHFNDGAGTYAGRAYVFSVRNRSRLHTFSGEAANDDFGYSVSSAGDVNNDGYDDVIIGAPRNSTAGLQAGRAYVFSCCCTGGRGDFNGDGANSNILDLTYIIDDIYRGGPASPCEIEADVNGDGTPSTVLDLTFVVNDLFRGGPAPGACY